MLVPSDRTPVMIRLVYGEKMRTTPSKKRNPNQVLLHVFSFCISEYTSTSTIIRQTYHIPIPTRVYIRLVFQRKENIVLQPKTIRFDSVKGRHRRLQIAIIIIKTRMSLIRRNKELKKCSLPTKLNKSNHRKTEYKAFSSLSDSIARKMKHHKKQRLLKKIKPKCKQAV